MNEKPARRNDARCVAIGIVRQWIETGDFPDRLIPAETDDRAFLTELVYGVARRRGSLQWILDKRIVHSAKKALLPYLYVGLYQILFMDTVAAYAAVNETVEAAKTRFHKADIGFLNACLRKAASAKLEMLADLASQRLAVKESHPDVLVRRWIKRYGAERAAALCEWNNGRATVVVHPNLARISRADFLTLLRAKGIEAAPHAAAPDSFFEMPRGVRVQDVPGYDEGLFSVQDPSTCHAIRLLDPVPGATLLDLCSAPGGKAMLAAERMGGSQGITAVELHEDRIARLRENFTRMKMDGVRIVRADASNADELGRALGGTRFDRVLLDVPCSNSGVLRRRPDARWRFSETRLRGLVAMQGRLIENAASLLAGGGVLVYSTCSLEPDEGEDVVSSWLSRHEGFELENSVRIFPPETGTDGVYAARIRKNTA